MKKLNLGCGNDYREGYINLDLLMGDVQCDIRKGLPFEDDTFDEILAYNVLTQIGEEFVFVMNELHRVLKGELYIRVPIVPHECAWQDPMDIRRFTKESFTYMDINHRRYEQYGKHYGFKPFSVEIVEEGPQWIFKLKKVKI